MSWDPSARWSGGFPTVGIRPTIDGRLGGVRESLETATLSQATAVAKLITSALRYPDGSPVECVVADTTIGGVAESAACAEKFSREGVGVSLTVTRCWCYGSETMDMDTLMPKAIWGFNGTERPGAVYLAAALAGHNQKGLPAFGIYGRDVQESSDKRMPADVKEKILRFVRAGLAVAMMKGRSYLSMGGCSMGIAGSIVDQPFFESYLGMRVEDIDMTEFLRRMDKGIYDPAEYTKALAWVKKNCQAGDDYNPKKFRRPRKDLDQEWKISVKMALIARDLMVGNPRLAELGFGEEAQGHHAIAAGFQGQRQWTDFQPNGDFLETMLNSSFDWNGIRAPYVMATENDALNGASMLMGSLLTHSAQIFADVRTYWSPAAVKKAANHTLSGKLAGGMIHLINSGSVALDASGMQTAGGKPAMKPFWEITPAEVVRCLKATTFHPSMTEYFPGGGWSTRFPAATKGGMPVTMCRLNLFKGLGPALQIAEGWTVQLPKKVNDALDQRTNPTWPTTWFVPNLTGRGPFRDVYSVMNAWGANHGAISYGHIGADLISLAAMLRIPVYMHNVAEEQVFRPTAWNGFGTASEEGADYRACAAYGPLYG